MKFEKVTLFFSSPFIMPRKEVVIGAAAQDVQMSGVETGCRIGAYPLALLTDEGSRRP
jgi:hypothetical protein